ncbi:hypothetical protein PLESTB_000823500 [Pleodorina starrii]|uniref:Pentacotripeptide-repeat region of PRORP domain-containing protein n=1 Tax=Pleodorina starrii TaxID=330485 RepID=A0A9W6BLG9_9CHLO|nr:hypothetical protein PLESTM_000139000 [Pleodorina starrii]GLC54098.1 hypothetical protein PLESTB_000823500 [Pleodorina starrii]GLC64597.1 hypothetical protein PLESTF_000182900 [Pleodorina starrii]
MNLLAQEHHRAAGPALAAVQAASSRGGGCVPIRLRGPESVASLILRAYAPRGGASGPGTRSHPLRAACIATAAFSQTVKLEGVDAEANSGSFARRPQPLLAAQDDVRAIQARLKSGASKDAFAGQCNQALQALCAAGERWSDVKQAYSDFHSAGIRLGLDTYRTLVTAAIEAKQGMAVVELMQHQEQLYGPAPMPVYCSVISRLLKSPGRGTPALQAAYAVWRMLRAAGHKLDAPAYRTGMNLCVEMGQIGEARRLMDAMRAAGHRPGWGAYHILIKYYAQRGDMDGARKMFAQLRAYSGDRPLEISAYNILLSGFVRLGDLMMARAVLDKARREGASPDAFTYSCYASGLAAAGRLDEAEALLSEMAAEGLPPSPVVYGAVLDGCARLSDWARAEHLLARMRADGLRPNVAHYNMLVRGRCYSVGHGALATASHGSGGGAAAGAGSPSGGSAAGGSGHVEALMAEMRAAGLRPDAVTYGTLVHAAVRSGSIDAALEVLAAMRVEGVQPDGAIFTSLMKLFRTQGRQAQALEFFQQMSSSRSAAVDLKAMSCLVAVHASAGQMAEAEEAQRRANALAAEQGRPPPVEAAYALLQGYGRQRHLRAALLAFRRFLAAGGRPHRKMCEFTYRLCLAHFDFGSAAQVLRAMRLMRGLELREALYRQQWEDAQRRLQARRQSASGGSSSSRESSGAATEKWKWWFGLPNNYYSTEWK